MRFLLLLFCALGPPAAAAAQAPSATDSLRKGAPVPTTALASFAADRTHLDQRGLAVLSGWALSNLLVSGLATRQTDGSAHYFHQMNIGWSVVNLVLAGTGYLTARWP